MSTVYLKSKDVKTDGLTLNVQGEINALVCQSFRDVVFSGNQFIDYNGMYFDFLRNASVSEETFRLVLMIQIRRGRM